MSGPAAAATPLINRSASWVSHPFGLGDTRRAGRTRKHGSNGSAQDIAPYATGGVWLNFIGDEGQARIRAAFGDENYTRLAQVKREFDPGQHLPRQPEHPAGHLSTAAQTPAPGHRLRRRDGRPGPSSRRR